MIDARLAPYGATLIRLSLAAMWISHGLLKLLVFTPAGFAGFLASQGYPSFLAWPTILAELVGGALILLGVYGRAVSIALLPVLLGALLVHLPNGWVFSAANGGWEFPAFLILTSLAHALIGDGAYALRPELPAGREAEPVPAR